MTLAVMTRASLGHSGRVLAAGPWRTAIYAAALGATLLRVPSGFVPGQAVLVHLAAGLWILAFAGFTLAFFGTLTGPRRASKKAGAAEGDARPIVKLRANY